MAVTGVAMRKLYRAASARSRPANSAADMEMPERLTALLRGLHHDLQPLLGDVGQ